MPKIKIRKTFDFEKADVAKWEKAAEKEKRSLTSLIAVTMNEASEKIIKSK